MNPLPSTQDDFPQRTNRGARNEILFITDRRFWRRSIGSEQRIASLILHLARRGEHVAVAYVGRAKGHDRAQFARFLSSAPNLEGLTRRLGWTTLEHALRKWLRVPRRLGSSRSTSLTEPDDFVDRNSPARRAFVQSVIEKRRPRIVIVEFLRLTYAVYPRGNTNAACRYWIDTHDILHKRAERYRTAGATVAHAISASEEIRILETYDVILAIQKPEGDLLRQLVPARPVIVVPHGIQLPILPERAAHTPGPTRLGFLGGRDESNRNALDWFVDRIWPKIRSRFGERVELHVAGQICHTWHRHDDGIVLVGPVGSIDLFWPDVDIAINPIRFGSGLKIKNIEALAYGRPLITTSIGAEGLEVASPNGLRIADSEREWAHCLDEWLSHPSSATRTGRAGRAYAKAHLVEDAAFHDLRCQIQRCLSRGESVSEKSSRALFLVLASRRAFEGFTGPIPDAMKTLFRFQKPRNATRIQALLPDCRIVISKNYARAQCNRWIFEARRLGIPTLLLVDGPLEWANLYTNPNLATIRESGATGLFEPIIHDAVATIGNTQTQWIASRNEGRGIELMSYANQRIQTRSGFESGNPSPEFDFLVTTAKTPYFSAREKTDLGAALSACGAALEQAGHRTLVRIFDEELRAMIRSTAPSCTFDLEGSFAQALSRTRCVVGTPSSVLFESMQHAKPTGLLMFRDSPLFYQTGWLLGCSEDWNASFASMLARDPARMELQRLSLRQNLSDDDFFSHCKRIADGELLKTPRPLDSLDLEFEYRVLRGMLGWRGRWLAAFLRARARIMRKEE